MILARFPFSRTGGLCCLMALAALIFLTPALLPTTARADHEDWRVVAQDEAARWNAVGSLRVIGRPACTAALISATEAITAAHCVVNRETGQPILPEYFTLVLGQTARGFAAVRKVTFATYLPDFVASEPVRDPFSLASDLALLTLSAPIPPEAATPLKVEDWPDPVGGFVDIVGYQRDGPRAATLREGCMAVQSGQGVTAVTCDVITGISGSPVFLSDRPDAPLRLVATVSSRARGMAFVVSLAPQLQALRALRP